MLNLSLKTSLREKTGQTYKWKLLMEIANAESAIKDKYDISYHKRIFRVLKPCGFCIVFSQARLYHRMAMSLDLAEFEIRDMLTWKYEEQAKAFSQSHFIKKDKNQTRIKELEGYKTPQLKPMVLAQN